MYRLGLVAVALLSAAPAVAQMQRRTATSHDTTVIGGTVASVCTVELKAPSATIDLQTTTAQNVSQVVYTCNDPNGFKRQISSQNSGALVRGDQSIRYLVSQTGNSGLALAPVSLAAPVTSEITSSRDLTEGSGAWLAVSVPREPPRLLAGEYSDVITIEITPN